MTAFLIANMAPLMFAALVFFLLLGYPVAFALAANGIVFGLIGIELGLLSPSLFGALPERLWGIMTNDTLLAIPFFTFMGLILERSGMAEDLLKNNPEADTNKDGTLSPDEMRALMKGNPGAMRQLFVQKHPEADANKDGQVSDEEMKTYREKTREQHRANRPGAPANP